MFKQNTDSSPISRHSQTGVRFSSWSRTLKLMVFVKIVKQWVLHHLHRWSPRRNEHALSTSWDIAFSSGFNWTADIWSMNSRASLVIFGSCLRQNVCECLNGFLLPFNKCNFHYFVICGLWFVSGHFVPNIVENSLILWYSGWRNEGQHFFIRIYTYFYSFERSWSFCGLWDRRTVGDKADCYIDP